MSDLDTLVNKAMAAGASACLMEAHRLLCIRQHYDAADALLRHRDSIIARADAMREASFAITAASRKETACS